jgi:hypothetical protein
VILAACAPAETTLDSPTMAPDASQEMEEATVNPTSTAAPVEPEATDTPARLELELTPEIPTKAAPVEEIYPMPDETPAAPPSDPYSLELIDKAKTDLAQRTGIAKEEIVLAEFRLVTWPDASLGCPKPGVEYAQVLVDGYLIMLRAGLGVYNYHGGGDAASGPFLCEGIGTKIIVPPPAGLGDT